MSTLRFNESYRSVIKVYKISGLPEPFYENQPKWKSWILKAYVSFIALFNTYTISISVMNLFAFVSLEEFCLMCTIIMLQGTTLFLTVFLAFFGHNLKILTDRLDGIMACLRDSKSFPEDFTSVTRQVNVVSVIGFTVSGMAPVFFCLTSPIMGYLSGHHREMHSLPYKYIIDVHRPGVFELFIVIQIFCLSIPAWQKLAIDCMMLGLYKTHSVLLKNQTETLEALGEEFKFGENEWAQKKFAQLIEISQKTRRNALDVIRFFSPVVVVYYISIICMVASGVFYQMNAKFPTGLQLVGLGSYMTVTVIQLYMQSDVADEIAGNLDKFGTALYNTPWYRMRIRNRRYLNLMILAANRPIRITAYSAPTFTLNRETFLAFLVNTLSAYMAFSKIYDLKE